MSVNLQYEAYFSQFGVVSAETEAPCNDQQVMSTQLL